MTCQGVFVFGNHFCHVHPYWMFFCKSPVAWGELGRKKRNQVVWGDCRGWSLSPKNKKVLSVFNFFAYKSRSVTNSKKNRTRKISCVRQHGYNCSCSIGKIILKQTIIEHNMPTFYIRLLTRKCCDCHSCPALCLFYCHKCLGSLSGSIPSVSAWSMWTQAMC